MSHQPIYLDTVTNSRQHNSRHEVHDLDCLLVDQVGAHVLGAAGAQNVILAILDQTQLPSIVYQTNLHSHALPIPSV